MEKGATEEMEETQEASRTPSRTRSDERLTESDEAECAHSESSTAHRPQYRQSETISESSHSEELRRSERT